MKNGAFKPPSREPADVTAIQLLEQGECPPDLQKRALEWIVFEACKTYDLSYRPGDTHETAFAEGRRFVGLEIVSMLKIDPKKLRRPGNE